ncbi:13258_t:CDS:2, partial [Racocetra persica]
MEEFVVNNNILYELAVNHNALYDNNQVNFSINEALYDNQTEFDIHNDVVYEIGQPGNKNNNVINFEDANYENTINQKWSYIVDDIHWFVNIMESPRPQKARIQRRKPLLNALVDEHTNHNLDRERFDFLENLEALEEKYFLKVYMPVLHRVIQRFRSKPRDQTNDASHLYEELVKKKETDPD